VRGLEHIRDLPRLLDCGFDGERGRAGLRLP
jgi:hypothetical protein